MKPSARVPELRIERANEQPIDSHGQFVVYWMIAHRRATWNFGLQRAVEWSQELNRPLVILEALRVGYRWASDRIHHFVLQGMADNHEIFATKACSYYPYVEPEPGAGSGLLEFLAHQACVVVTDEFPCFFLPRMVDSVGRRLPVALETVDSNGILPLRATDRVFPTAHAFRRFLQKELTPHLREFPRQDPLAEVRLPRLESLPAEMVERWPAATPATLRDPNTFNSLPIDHSVQRASFSGGSSAAEEVLRRFFKQRWQRYAVDRNSPDEEAASGLSPYLHFGHVSTHQIVSEIMQRERWSSDSLATQATGSREGWWGMSQPSESFLDELITWREVGYNMCHLRPDSYDNFDSLPTWALQTIDQHAADERPFLYELAEFEEARTHDPVWNAAQRQLVREGRMHNYLRMLWGKKIYHWSPTAEDALRVMIELNNKYAVDGRNPNSYSGIFWVLGRYDRAWGPERPVFGKLRYMTSDNTARKLKLKNYLHKYAADPDGAQGQLF